MAGFERRDVAMKCKNKLCDLPIRHAGRCKRLTGAINNEPAINTVSHSQAQPEMGAAVVAASVDAEARAPNGRSRADYNRYMRDYMRRKRAGFIGIPYG
jgi:hypothetical protein